MVFQFINKIKGSLASNFSLTFQSKNHSKKETPVEENFIEKAVRIVKEQGKQTTQEQMQVGLHSLNATLVKPISPEEVAEIIRRVKVEAPECAVVLPELLSYLRDAHIVGLERFEAISTLIGSIVDLSSFDESIRFECAKKDLGTHERIFCENMKANKYGTLSLEHRKELCKCLSLSQKAESVAVFDLDMNTREELALSLVDQSYLSDYLDNFKLNEPALLQIASSIIKNGGAFQVAENVQNYGRSNKNKIGEMLFEKDLTAYFKFLEKSDFREEPFPLEMVQKALKENPSLASKVASLHLKDRKNIIALMACVSHTPENLQHFAFFFKDKENRTAILLECPELAYWVFQNHPEELRASICYLYPHLPLSLFKPFFALYKKMQREEDPVKKAEMTKHFVLASIALTQAKKSPEWASSLTALIDDLQKPLPKRDNPKVREQKNQWLANFLFQARMRNLSPTLLLKYMPMIKAVLDLKAPFLRTCLQDNLMKFFTNPEALAKFEFCKATILKSAKDSNKKMKEAEQRNLAAKREEKLSTLLMMLCPYLSTESLERITVQLFKNKNFEDDVRMKSLLSKLQVILGEPRLADQEKARLLNEVIFVEERSQTSKQQADAIITSAGLVMQYLEFDKIELLQTLHAPQKLREHIKTMFIEQLGLEALGKDFDAQYANAFSKAKRTDALLTYAANIKNLPKEESDGVFTSIRTFAKGVLTNSFDNIRNSTETSEHIATLEREAPGALAELQKEFSYGAVKLIKKPWSLFFAGHDTGTCQSFATTDTEWSRGMMASVIKGEVFQLVVTKTVIDKEGEEEEVVVAKRSIRLLLDKDTHRPVLYQGDTLPWDLDNHENEFDAACKALSDKLTTRLGYSVPLLSSVVGPKAYPGTIACLPCQGITFEYVEGADQELSCHSIVQGDQGYTISKAKIVYDPANKD